MTVRSLFKNRKRWVKYTLNTGAGPTKCYCLIGALGHRYGVDEGFVTTRQRNLYAAARQRVQLAINLLFPHRADSITVFNDHEDTTIEDVRRVCRRARV